MSSIIKKGAKVVRKTNLAGNIMDKAGASNSNFFRRALDPAGPTIRAAEEGGHSAVLNQWKTGEITDPGRLFHSMPAPDPSAPPPAPSLGDAASNVTSVRARRRRGVLANMYGMGGENSRVGRRTLG